jgi:hypothetical protein
MSFRIKLLSLLLVPSLLLIGCSGSGSDFNLGGNGSDFNLGGNGGDFGGGGTTDSSEGSEDDSGAESTNTSTISYFPLSVYQASSDFSESDEDGFFRLEVGYPFIWSYLINPVIASSLASTQNAVVSDYVMTIDDVEIDSSESFPILQKVLGNPANLNTALVFDISGSVNNVDFAELVIEAKAYVAASKLSSSELIANQEFVVWAFGKEIAELTAGFTSDSVVINAALDLVVTRRNDGSLSTSSNLHKAVVEVIGSYMDDTNDFRDSSTPEGDNNDLIDSTSSNGVDLSQMVLFSSGPDTFLEFDRSLMVSAITSQGFLKYENAVEVFTKKPVFYYVLGGLSQGEIYEPLSAEAETTSLLTLVAGEYRFSTSLIENQISAIESRIDLDNQYIYRYAFLPRVGEHSMLFKSNTTTNNYSLLSGYDEDELVPFVNVGTPSEVLASIGDIVFGTYEPAGLVEITGPNGEYLSINPILNRSNLSLADVSTFLPETRWVNDEYVSADYAWSFPGGGGTGVLNANGSYTVNSITGSDVVLQLENIMLGYTAEIILNN